MILAKTDHSGRAMKWHILWSIASCMGSCPHGLMSYLGRRAFMARTRPTNSLFVHSARTALLGNASSMLSLGLAQVESA